MGAFDNNQVSNFSTEGEMTAFVLTPNSRKNLDNVKAYVPKLMSGIDMKDDVYEEDVQQTNSCILNDNFEIEAGEIKQRNFIYLTGTTRLGRDSDISNKGQMITANFTDGDLNRGNYTSIYSSADNNTSQINTRFRQFVENAVELEKQEEFQDDNPSITYNRESSSSSGSSSKTKSSRARRSRAKKSLSSLNDTVNNKSKAGSTKSTKPESDQYDMIMDTSNRIMGLRMATSDYICETMGDEIIPQLIIREKIDDEEMICREAYLTNALGMFKLSESGPLALMTNNGKYYAEILDNVITITNVDGTMKMTEDDIKIDYNKSDFIHIKENDIHVENSQGIYLDVGETYITGKNDNTKLEIGSDSYNLECGSDTHVYGDHSFVDLECNDSKVTLTNGSIVAKNSDTNLTITGDNFSLNCGDSHVSGNSSSLTLQASGASIILSGGEIYFSSNGGSCSLTDIINHMNSGHGD